ncbi:MAG TPA: acyl-CoA dehydrogenase [Streptosporangiaceae bacterium]|nr:acyl-CoA dehydrogenase [Streptosporangiaceae bacterium]
MDQAARYSTEAVAAAFAELVSQGQLDLPLPASGATRQRWRAFEMLGANDLSLARLAEGHADALAILAELDGPDPARGSLWGVWAAQPPGQGLTARRVLGRWLVNGVKQYCSGARSCTDALVTATAPDGDRLFVVSTRTLSPVPGTWPAVGMAASDTLDVEFSDIPAVPLGEPGDYVSRPGFSHGGIGVAACWHGGARAIGQTLARAAAARDIGPHALAHLGAVDIALRAATSALDDAAAEIDDDPLDRKAAGRALSLRVRALVEATATQVMERVGRALGAGPLCHDEAHARRVADLTVYLRQHHAERALAELGGLVAKTGTFMVTESGAGHGRRDRR